MRYARLVILAISISVGFVALGQTHTKSGARPDIAAGRELFHQHCSTCHGVNGTGPESGTMYDPNSLDPARRVPPADLTLLSKHNGGKFPEDRVKNAIYSKDSIAAHGTPEMPAWGDVFYREKSNPKVLEKRVRDLTAFIESIQATKKN